MYLKNQIIKRVTLAKLWTSNIDLPSKYRTIIYYCQYFFYIQFGNRVLAWIRDSLKKISLESVFHADSRGIFFILKIIIFPRNLTSKLRLAPPTLIRTPSHFWSAVLKMWWILLSFSPFHPFRLLPLGSKGKRGGG
jgi:hypothetical protein